jgi:hypothetical protein
MTHANFKLIKDVNGDAIPQYLGIDGTPKSLVGGRAPYSQVVNEVGEVLFSNKSPGNVIVSGSKVSEQLTETDAIGSILTFSKTIETIELYNTDLFNDGVFNVNGINIKVPKGQAFKAAFGGIPKSQVIVTGCTSYIVTRYE